MPSHLLELQNAVCKALGADGALAPLITGIFNHVPEKTGFPYINLSEMEDRAWSTDTSTGARVNFTVFIHSRYRGGDEVLNISAEIKRLLHNQVLEMKHFTMMGMRLMSQEVERLKDGVTWQGSLKFLAWVEG